MKCAEWSLKSRNEANLTMRENKENNGKNGRFLECKTMDNKNGRQWIYKNVKQ